MILKNISGGELTVGSVIFGIDESIPLYEFGDKSEILKQASDVVSAIVNNSIEARYNDGTIFEDILLITNYLQGDNSNVTISNVNDIGISIAANAETSRSYNNYYFLKDNISIKKNKIIQKFFRGRVKTLTLYSSKQDIDIKILTGDGVELPGENIIKRQEIEFNFDGDIKDIVLEITAKGNTEVDVFMEGFNNTLSPEELQIFVDSWYSNEEMWLTTGPIIVDLKDNAHDIDAASVIYENDGNHKLIIPSNRANNQNKYFKIYKVTDREYQVEWVEENKWSTWSTDRYAVRAKNINYIVFNDQTVNLSSEELNDIKEHCNDKKRHKEDD